MAPSKVDGENSLYKAGTLPLTYVPQLLWSWINTSQVQVLALQKYQNKTKQRHSKLEGKGQLTPWERFPTELFITWGGSDFIAETAAGSTVIKDPHQTWIHHLCGNLAKVQGLFTRQIQLEGHFQK